MSGEWTPEAVIDAIEFDENGPCSWTPGVAAHIERTFGVTVEEFCAAAAEWAIPRMEHLYGIPAPDDN